MRKIVYAATAALSLVATSTLAMAEPVQTPLTQPASETVSGDDDILALGLPLLLVAVAAAAAAAVVATSISESGDSVLPDVSPTRLPTSS